MKFYVIEDPHLYEYARFTSIGTWLRGELCGACGLPTSKLVAPLLVEWDADSDIIADFSWNGFIAIVKENVGMKLIDFGLEVELDEVRIVEPKGNVSQKKGKAQTKIVEYPYVGEPLKWIKSRHEVPIDEESSSVGLLSDCRVCGQKKYSFKKDGLVIKKSDWHDLNMFTIKQFPRSRVLYVTENGKEILENITCSNINIAEAGIMV